jgi:spore germination protein GerM
MPRRKKNTFPLGWLVGVGLALFAAGGATAWFTVRQLASREPVTSPVESPTGSNPVEPAPESPRGEIEPSPPAAEPSPVAEQPVTEKRSLYWLKVTGTGSELVPRAIEVQKSTNSATELENLLRSLLAGPTDPNDTTTIPSGTKLLSLKEDKEGIRVNLSREFTDGGGSDALIGRLAQVLYTATSLDPSAAVWFSVDGQPLELLGEGDGLEVPRPLTRKLFEENYQLSGN